MWSSSLTESSIDSLQNFYGNLHTWLISLAEEILALFGDRDDGRPSVAHSPVDVMVTLLQKGSTAVAADLRRVIRGIPAGTFRHALESAFSYMEIIVSGLSGAAAKQTALECLLGPWEEYVVSELATVEYNEMNDLLNRVVMSVGALGACEA